VIPLVALLVAVLALPAAAQAKVTCTPPAGREPGAPLHGLPDHPIADRTYRLTATLPDRGVNPVPHLGAEYCGHDRTPESVAGAGGWFRRVPGAGGSFALELRFPSAGPWAVSFMDRDGRFHELGILTVLPADGFSPSRSPRVEDRGAALLRRPLRQALWIFAS
jgi:hypothetical protein